MRDILGIAGFTAFLGIVFLAGFFAGTRHAGNRVVTEMEYVRLPTVSDSVVPVLVSEVTPEVSALPVRRDTLYRDSVVYVRTVTDTAAILADYERRRSYIVQLFDNQYGRLDLSLSARYNRVEGVSYDFSPMREVVYASRTWETFVLGQASTVGGFGVGVGVFHQKTGVYLLYSGDSKRRGFGAGVIYRF
jgi:hypothetical protein